MDFFTKKISDAQHPITTLNIANIIRQKTNTKVILTFDLRYTYSQIPLGVGKRNQFSFSMIGDKTTGT